MHIQVVGQGWKSRVVLAGVISVGTSCGAIDQGQPEEAGDDVIVSQTSALTAGAVVPFEAENLTRAASAIGSKVTTEGTPSGGKYVEFNGTASQAGSWIEFVLPNIVAGPYSLTFLYKSNSNRGIVQASIDGVDQGGPCNEYAGSPAYRVVCALGNKTLSAGNHTIRFRVTGKSASSSGYQMVVDQISLTFAGQCTSVAECGAGYLGCVANKCVCRQKSAGNLLSNPGFDGNLNSWQTSGGASYSFSDADNCPGSGSVQINSLLNVARQCVPVTAGTRYYFGVRYKNAVYCYLAFYGGTTCDSANSLSGTVDLIDNVGSSDWGSLSGFRTAPAGAGSAAAVCSGAIGSGVRDQLYVNAGSNAF